MTEPPFRSLPPLSEQNNDDMAAAYGLLSMPDGVRATILPHRACEACKRKKTKCDMKRPICSLCVRTGNVCTFPTYRKRPANRTLNDRPEKRQRSDAVSRTDAQSTEVQFELPDVSEISANEVPAPPTFHLENTDFGTIGADGPWSYSPFGFLQDISDIHGIDLAMSIPELSSLLPNTPFYNGTHLQQSDNDLHETGEPHQTEDNEETEKNVTLTVTASTALSLIETYFEKIHACFPIINRSAFTERLSDSFSIGDQRPTLPLDLALLIYGMMALSARFSSSQPVSTISRKQRGCEFARSSGILITQLLLDSDLDAPSLTFLHGCSLAAVYQLTCAPNGKAWNLVGICVRIAYSLSLHTIDEDLRVLETKTLPDHEWVTREELRRAWWLVVECDNFASVIRCRPLTIDQSRMHVLLPSSDEQWLSGKPQASAFLDDDIVRSWKQLKASPNRNPHAWYLLANRLMIQGHELSLKHNIEETDRRDLQDVIQCVTMSLPHEFELNKDIISFEEDSVGYDNWVIAVHLMLQAALTYTVETDIETSRNHIHTGLPSLPTTNEDSTNESSPHIAMSPMPWLKQYRSMLNTIIRALRIWSSGYCVEIQPFQVCAILGPHAAYVQATFAAQSASRGSLERDLIRETVARIAEYWDIASATLDVMEAVTRQFSPNPTSDKMDTSQRLRCLMPRATAFPQAIAF